MAAIRKPKAKKYPKKPKASASNEVMERYLQKRKEIDKDNAKALADYQKAVKKRATLKKQIASL